MSKIHKGKDITVKEAFSTLYDGRTLAIEELEEPEDLHDDDRLIWVRQYYPDKHITSEPKSIIIKNTITMGELQKLFAEIGGFNEENISIAKPYSSQKLTDPDVVRELTWRKYCPPEKSDLTLDKFSWMIFDADTFVFKDTSNDPRAISVQIDENNTSSTVSNNSIGNSNTPTTNNNKFSSRSNHQERSLKINVAKESIDN